MDQSQAISRLSVKDQERLNSVILNDYLSLAGRANCFGTVFDRSGLIEQTFTLQMSSNDRLVSPAKGMSDTLFIVTNSISGLVCLSGSLASSQIAELSLLWETMLLKLFLEIPESQIGGVLLLKHNCLMVNRGESSAPSIPRMLSANLSLSRSFEWIARNSTSL